MKKLVKIGTIIIITTPIVGVVSCTKNNNSQGKILKAFDVQLKAQEQSKIDAITNSNIKANDGLKPFTKIKITPPTNSTSIKNSIEKYLISLNKILGWIVTINLFNSRQASGGLDYTVVLSKVGYISKTINVSYVDGSFKTTAELEEQLKIDAITTLNIKANDGLKPFTKIKITPPTSSTSIKTSIQDYINTLNVYPRWIVKINSFILDAIGGALDYTVVLSKTGYISKIINVSYIDGSFKTIAELMAEGREKIIVLLQNIKANDGLNPFTNIKITPPTSPTSIKNSIEKYLISLNVVGWNIAINLFEPDIVNGGLEYKVVLSKVEYVSIPFHIIYIDGSFKTTAELKEQSKIDAITMQNVKTNDGLTSKVDIPIWSEIKISIEKYVNSLNGVSSGWKAFLNPFILQASGGFDYTVVLSKVGYASISFSISYIDGSFKTKIELEKQSKKLKEQSKIDSINSINIKTNDGLNSPINAKIVTPASSTSIKASIEKYVNSLNGVLGWTIIIKNFSPHPKIGSLSYEVFLSKTGYSNKKISVIYPPGTFKIFVKFGK